MAKYLRYGIGMIIISFSVISCAPYINAGNKNMVTIYVPHTNYESDALALADKHCEQYGGTAKLRKPRDASSFGELYDYNCVKN